MLDHILQNSTLDLYRALVQSNQQLVKEYPVINADLLKHGKVLLEMAQASIQHLSVLNSDNFMESLAIWFSFLTDPNLSKDFKCFRLLLNIEIDDFATQPNLPSALLTEVVYNPELTKQQRQQIIGSVLPPIVKRVPVLTKIYESGGSYQIRRPLKYTIPPKLLRKMQKFRDQQLVVLLAPFRNSDPSDEPISEKEDESDEDDPWEPYRELFLEDFDSESEPESAFLTKSLDDLLSDEEEPTINPFDQQPTDDPTNQPNEHTELNDGPKKFDQSNDQFSNQPTEQEESDHVKELFESLSEDENSNIGEMFQELDDSEEPIKDVQTMLDEAAIAEQEEQTDETLWFPLKQSLTDIKKFFVGEPPEEESEPESDSEQSSATESESDEEMAPPTSKIPTTTKSSPSKDQLPQNSEERAVVASCEKCKKQCTNVYYKTRMLPTTKSKDHVLRDLNFCNMKCMEKWDAATNDNH